LSDPFSELTKSTGILQNQQLPFTSYTHTLCVYARTRYMKLKK